MAGDFNARVGTPMPLQGSGWGARPGPGELAEPLSKAVRGAPTESPLDALARMGIKRDDDGGYHLSADAMHTIRNERLRRATVSRVPSTPRFVNRDAGGVGVRKGSGRFFVYSHDTLRAIRERAPIIQAIHAARATQVRRMSVRWNGKRGDVGWRVVHRDHFEHNATTPEYIKPFIARFERMLEAPAERYNCRTTGSLLGPLEEDLLTINRPVVEKLYSAYDRKRVVGFRWVDGAMIWPTNLWLQKWMAENPQWYAGRDPSTISDDDALDLISEIVRYDVAGADFCCVRDGILEAVYTPGRLIVAPFVNRTNIDLAGYWPSNVEQAIEIILTFINTWDFNATMFTRGMMAEFILGITGDVHDDDIDAFVDMFREATQGVKRAWQPPIMPLPENGTITKIDLKPTNRDLMFDTFLALQSALATAVYRMDPSTINARPWDGGSSAALGAGNRNMEIALAKEEGLQGDMQHLNEEILTPLAMNCHPDLRVVFQYGDFDPQKEAAIYEVRARTSITRNEVRLAEGMEPRGSWVEDDKLDGLGDEEKQKYDDNPWNWPTDPGFAQAIQAQKMAEQQAQAGQDGQWGQPGQEGQPGADDGFGQPETGQGDGYGQPAQQAPYGQPPGQGGAPPQPGAPAVSPGSQAAPQLPMAKGQRRRALPTRGPPGNITVYVEDYGPRE